MRLFLSILLLFILTSNTTAFGRRKSSKCGVDCVSTSSNRDQNKTSDYYYDCDPKLGIVQKIPYLRSCSTCNAIEIDFSSACIRCGMCLAISDKINQTLMDVQEMLPDGCLNDTEIELLLRTICDHSFQQIKDLCHYYLDAVGELELYEKWQQWCKDPDNFPNLSNVLCRSMHGMLHDCRSMEDLNPYEPPYKTYNAKVKFTASYDKCSKRE
nr:PREDICTED: uncharacterized protein LOC100880997 isoform X3 [Megachile rotundata]